MLIVNTTQYICISVISSVSFCAFEIQATGNAKVPALSLSLSLFYKIIDEEKTHVKHQIQLVFGDYRYIT